MLSGAQAVWLPYERDTERAYEVSRWDRSHLSISEYAMDALGLDHDNVNRLFYEADDAEALRLLGELIDEAS